MSFRSTEFIDDSARDNQATNTLEIKEKGWAFGQIDDMERWHQSLRDDKTIGDGEEIILTEYSLGGHLATAFNILHKDEKRIKNTYTFNGAGVGRKFDNTEMDKVSLTEIINDFNKNRRADNLREFFGESIEEYNESKNTINSHDLNKIKELETKITRLAERESIINGHLVAGGMLGKRATELTLLAEAILRSRIVLEENERVSKLRSGNSDNPTPPIVDAKDIAATNLDYQIAVLLAAKETSAYSALNPFNGESGFNNLVFDERNVIKKPYEGFL